MKIRYIATVCVAALLTLTGCDKKDPYVVFAGAMGEWYDDANGVNDHTQRAFLEKYTGVRCTNCPTADGIINTALAKYNGKLIAVAVHPSNDNFTRPYSGDPDLRTECGAIWGSYFGITGPNSLGLPNALLNRKLPVFSPLNSFDDKVDAIVNQPAGIALAVDCNRTEGNELQVTAHIEYLAANNRPLTLTLLIMEDSLVVSQSLPDHSTDDQYVQNHVLRDVITDAFGTDIQADGSKGCKRFAVFYYEANAQWNLKHCHIVAFVSDEETDEIQNVAQCGIGNL